jgi:hypothetical protein
LREKWRIRTGVGINVEERLRISGFELVGQPGIAIAVNGRDSGDGRLGRRILGDVDPVDGLGRQRDVIVLIQNFYKYLGEKEKGKKRGKKITN